VSRPGAAPEKLDLLAAPSGRKVADEGGISTARLTDGLAALLRRLAVQPEGIAVVHAAAGWAPDKPSTWFNCKNDAGRTGAVIEMPLQLFERLFVQIYGGDRIDTHLDKPSGTQLRFAQRLGNRLCEWLEGALPGTEKPSFTQSESALVSIRKASILLLPKHRSHLNSILRFPPVQPGRCTSAWLQI
jgi:hypothetical protein